MITSLGEDRDNSAFRAFVRFTRVWFCLYPFPFGVWVILRFVIVALSGLFSYLFFSDRAVIPVLVLLFVVVYSTRRFTLSLALCYFVLVFSILLALRLPRLGKRTLILVLSVRLFDFCACLILSISSSF